MKRILFATAKSHGVQMHRVQYPAAHMQETCTILPLGFQSIPEGFTHIVFNSVFTYTGGKQQEMLKACKDIGLQIVLDVDDYWHGPRNRSDQYAKDVLYCIENADVVWCASKELLHKCNKINKNSHYIPNATPNQLGQPKGQGQRFGYVASAQDHYQDALVLSNCFRKMSKNKIPDAEIGWCGYQTKPEGEKMRQLFATAGRHFIGNYQTNSAYWWHYRAFDTALAPLENTTFNQHKSALKAVEAGAMGCAFICSDSTPYAAFEHNVDCLKAKSKFDWYKLVKKLHKDPQLAFALSQNLQELVKDMFNPQQLASDRLQTLS
jgi:hypothetical protein